VGLAAAPSGDPTNPADPASGHGAQPGGPGQDKGSLGDELADPLKVGRLWTGTPVVPPGRRAKKGEAPASLVKTMWRPGQAGGGHEHVVPSYRTLMRRRLKQLAAELGKKGLGPEDEEMLIVEAHLSMIMQDRSVAALKEWLDREHGPVVQKVEQNLNVQDVTRVEFESFMIAPREADVVEPAHVGQAQAQVEPAAPAPELDEAVFHDDAPMHDPAETVWG
jgi:hypothetical protein